MTYGLQDFLVTHDLSLGIANSLQNNLKHQNDATKNMKFNVFHPKVL